MTEEEAHKLVMGLLLQNAKGEDENVADLSHGITTFDDMGMMFQAALSVAYAAHIALANLEGVGLIPFLEEMAMNTAAVPEESDEV